jgi:hypothetical protein
MVPELKFRNHSVMIKIGAFLQMFFLAYLSEGAGPLPPEAIYKYYHSIGAPSAEKDSLSKDQIKAYLRDHDPTFGSEFNGIAASDRAFRETREKHLDQATDDFMDGDYGHQIANSTQFAVYKKAFIDYLTSQVYKHEPQTAARGVGPKSGVPPTEPQRLFPIHIGSIFIGQPHLSKSSVAANTAAGQLQGGPAQFNWSTPETQKSSYSVDAAATIEIEPLLGLGVTPWDQLRVVPTAEAHTSSITTGQQNSISGKLQIIQPFTLSSPVTLLAPVNTEPYQTLLPTLKSEGALLQITPNYETNRQQTLETYGSDILLTPLFTPLYRNGSKYVLTVVPSIGLESGFVYGVAKHSIYGQGDDFSRFVARLHGELYITRYFLVVADFYDRMFLTASKLNYAFIDVSPNIILNPDPSSSLGTDPMKLQFSVGLDFKYGKTTPQFNEVHSISAFLGLKF